jgi:hypothetical protein
MTPEKEATGDVRSRPIKVNRQLGSPGFLGEQYQECRVCLFFAFAGDFDGDCRRYPPGYVSNTGMPELRPVSPLVHVRSWCGEFKPCPE